MREAIKILRVVEKKFGFKLNVVEAPDAATIARVSVALGARGSTKIRTLTALTIEEFLAALG